MRYEPSLCCLSISLLICFEKHILVSYLAEIPYCYLPADHITVSCFSGHDAPISKTFMSFNCMDSPVLCNYHPSSGEILI